MATSAISAEVQAANSKLAQFLRSQEEEDMILQIGKRKPKEPKDRKLPGVSRRWLLEPDWRAPTPLVDRPRTSSGATSFHFSYVPIVKLAVPTVRGKPVEGPFGTLPKGVHAHAEYVERDGAAEIVWAAHHASYVERPHAVEQASQNEGEGRERTMADVINEAYADEEGAPFGQLETGRGGAPSIFSNISDDPFERVEFWRSVERFEAAPKSHQIILKPDVAPDWWSELPTTSLLPPDFHAHALRVAEAYRQHVAKSALNPDEAIPFEAEPFKVDSEQAGYLIEAAQSMAHYDNRLPPLDFKSGSGGTIQIRIVAELPHEISAEDRALIAQNFCDHLAALTVRHDEDGKPYKAGMMYTGVIHKPDGHNDPRNYHLHVVAYDRPCRFLPEYGMWDFEVDEVYVDPKSGKERTRHPHRQNKIREASGRPDNGDPQTTGLNFIPGLRAKFAEINNAVLEARGINRRLDPRKYSEMGIDRTPTEHLGTRAAALEAIGVTTVVGGLNAIAIWSDAERAIEDEASLATADYAAAQERFERLPDQVAEADPNDTAFALGARRLVTERRQITRTLAQERKALMLFDLREAKAKSRARRTQRTCLSYLADIEAGRADRGTRANQSSIQARLASAQLHIDVIDNALEPHRGVLAKAAQDIEGRERRVVDIDEALLRVANSLGGLRIGARVQAAARGKRESEVQILGPQNQPKAAPPPPNVTTIDAAALGDPAETEPSKIALPSTPDVQPITIGGVPIVESTIAPRESAAVEPTELQEGTPQGLEPLRPVETNEPSAALGELVLFELSDVAAGSDMDTQKDVLPVTALAAGTSTIAASTMQSSTSGVQSVEEQAGVRQAPLAAEQVHGPLVIIEGPDIQPAGTPQQVQPFEGTDLTKGPSEAPKSLELTQPQEMHATDPAAPADRPARAAAGLSSLNPDYVKFDALVVRIKDERIPISRDAASSFVVPSLTSAEQKLLCEKRVAKRAQARLDAIYKHQRQEIDRSIRWIETTGQNPEMLWVENRKVKLGSRVSQSVRTLLKHWGAHDDVLAAARREFKRRNAAEKAAAGQVQTINRELEERRRKAGLLYPTPDQAFTPEVAEYIRLLREAASDDQLREAADRIRVDARACEDITRHNVELKEIYESFIDSGDGQPQHDRSPGLGR